MKIFLVLLFLGFVHPGFDAMAKTKLRSDHVEIELFTFSRENSDWIGVKYRLDPDWHIYWKNPGDSGAAPKFSVKGATLQEIRWPYPVRISVSGLTNFGYENETVLFLKLAREAGAEKVELDLEWLVCKVECIPGFGTLSFSSPDELKKDPVLLEKYWSQIPISGNDWRAETLEVGESFRFVLTPPLGAQLASLKEFFVFPEDGSLFQSKLPKVDPVEKGLEISIPLSPNATLEEGESHLTFVSVDSSGEATAFTKQVSMKAPSPSWLRGLLLAFLGGLILNLMPCVFPVLSLKVFSFLKETDPKEIRSSAWGYTFGVLATFLVVGATLTFLRLSGEAIGWGYQLQSPILVFFLAALFFAMALNFLGFLELGTSVANSAGRVTGARFFSGSFGTGVLAVLVASPCTAPFMGSALGLTLLLPWTQSLVIFLSLGLGMAAPLLLVAYVPKLAHWLPRSGRWMEVVKEAMAFPMFATALWLLWVLAQQRGGDGVVLALAGFVLFGFGLWIRRITSNNVARGIAALIVIASMLFPAWAMRRMGAPLANASSSTWNAFDPSDVEERRKKQDVFVDFTASWCITCQVNKKGVLDTAEIQQLFQERNVYLVRADWTNHDPKITAALSKFQRNSVPLYVFYSKDGKQVVLPEILTKAMIQELIGGKSE